MKEELLNLHSKIVEAFEKYTESLESTSEFWDAMDKMYDYINANIEED